MKTLHFREYGQVKNHPLTQAEVGVLRNRFRCSVTRADTGDGLYDVRAADRVGTVLVDGTSIVLAPKLAISRVLFLIAHAIDPTWAEDATLDEKESLTEAVASLFIHLCDRATRTGVLRGYRNRHDRLHTVRGRIDFTQQLRRSPGRDLPLAVSYQSHDEDILENQLLAAAVEKLTEAQTYSTKTQRSLVRLRRLFEGVTPPPLHRGHLPEVRWTRLNEHYRPAVELARLILTETEADLGTGRVAASGFVVTMHEVFEKFVRTATRRALGLTEHEFPDGKHAPPLHLDDQRKLNVQPDLSHWVDGQCRFVGELKYRMDTGTGDAQHLYQTLAYATATGLPDATLIYADGPPTGSIHSLPRAATRIHIRHLNLASSTNDILGQIGHLAQHIKRSAARHAVLENRGMIESVLLAGGHRWV
jgi:5-methylcytosine-specific restriction enzyme subunit McrC